MTSIRDEWTNWVAGQLEAERDELERLLAEAIRLTPFTEIDTLIVVRQDGCAPGVACMVPR